MKELEKCRVRGFRANEPLASGLWAPIMFADVSYAKCSVRASKAGFGAAAGLLFTALSERKPGFACASLVYCERPRSVRQLLNIFSPNEFECPVFGALLLAPRERVESRDEVVAEVEYFGVVDAGRGGLVDLD